MTKERSDDFSVFRESDEFSEQNKVPLVRLHSLMLVENREIEGSEKIMFGY